MSISRTSLLFIIFLIHSTAVFGIHELSITAGDGTTRNFSLVNSLSILGNGLLETEFTLRKQGDANPIVLLPDPSSTSQSISFTFSGPNTLPAGELSDGRYVLYRNSEIIHTFPVLKGDMNGDAVISNSDMNIVRRSNGKRAGEAGYFHFVDILFNGIIDSFDLNEVRNRLFVSAREVTERPQGGREDYSFAPSYSTNSPYLGLQGAKILASVTHPTRAEVYSMVSTVQQQGVKCAIVRSSRLGTEWDRQFGLQGRTESVPGLCRDLVVSQDGSSIVLATTVESSSFPVIRSHYLSKFSLEGVPLVPTAPGTSVPINVPDAVGQISIVPDTENIYVFANRYTSSEGEHLIIKKFGVSLNLLAEWDIPNATSYKPIKVIRDSQGGFLLLNSVSWGRMYRLKLEGGNFVRDFTFGNTNYGEFQPYFNGAGYNYWLTDVRLDPNGKILIAGKILTSYDHFQPILIRLNSDGKYDQTLNQTGTIFVSDFTTGLRYDGDYYQQEAVLVRPVGSDGSFFLTYSHVTAPEANPLVDGFILNRYTPNGQLSASFLNGLRTTLTATDSTRLRALLTTADGQVIVTGIQSLTQDLSLFYSAWQ